MFVLNKFDFDRILRVKIYVKYYLSGFFLRDLREVSFCKILYYLIIKLFNFKNVCCIIFIIVIVIN